MLEKKPITVRPPTFWNINEYIVVILVYDIHDTGTPETK